MRVVCPCILVVRGIAEGQHDFLYSGIPYWSSAVPGHESPFFRVIHVQLLTELYVFYDLCINDSIHEFLTNVISLWSFVVLHNTSIPRCLNWRGGGCFRVYGLMCRGGGWDCVYSWLLWSMGCNIFLFVDYIERSPTSWSHLCCMMLVRVVAAASRSYFRQFNSFLFILFAYVYFFCSFCDFLQSFYSLFCAFVQIYWFLAFMFFFVT